MIDTITIKLPLKKVHFKNDDEFRPISLSEIYYFRPQKYIKTIFNPGKTLAKNTMYTPTYVGEKILASDGTGVGYFLKVEVSLPKLLFGNNVEELSPGEEFLSIIVKTLQDAISRDLGIRYTTEEILSGDVVKIHIGKNFKFDDPGAPTTIVQIICKSRADRRCDDRKKEFENLGYAFKMHANKKEVICYDKISDIELSFKSPKRALDDGIQEGVKDECSNLYDLMSDRFTGILRLEVRLNNKTYIRKAFPEVGNDLSLQNVYLNAKIMERLIKEWHDTTEYVSMIKLGRNDVVAIFESIAANRINNGYSLREALAIAAAAYIINDNTLNYLRTLVEKYYSKDEWYRLRKKLITPESYRTAFFRKIEDGLHNYKPIRL